MNINTILEIVIYGLPAILLFLHVFIAINLGINRGLRKSSILLLHSTILLIIFVILYLLMVETNFGDRLILSIVNIFFGGAGGIQQRLGVSTDLIYFRDVLRAYLTNYLESQGSINGLAAVLEGTSSYVNVLSNYLYHVLFMLLFSILYWIFDFVLYMIYIIFNSDAKKEKKQRKAFMKGEEYTLYHKNRFAGALVGFARGMVSGIIMLSFLGGTLFMLTGDDGKGTLTEYDFKDDNVNTIYTAYSYLDSYSEKGVFKYLNAAQDEEEGPIYLFLVDLMNKGTITEVDEETGETKKYTLELRKEISSYTKLAKSIVNTMLVHSEEEKVQGLVNGTVTPQEFLNYTVNKMIADSEFQADLMVAINEFPEQTYITNFATALINSAVDVMEYVVNNSTMSDSQKTQLIEPVKILLKKGFYSDYIKEEKELKESGFTEVLPYLDITSLINKRNIVIAIEAALSLVPKIYAFQNQGGFTIEDYVDMVDSIVTYLKEMTLFDEAYREKFNGTFGRLFYYLDERYLEEDSELRLNINLDGLTKSNPSDTEDTSNRFMAKISKYQTYYNKITYNINWIGELESILDVATDAVKVYGNILSINQKKSEAGETPAIKDYLELFNPESEYYDSTTRAFDNIASILYNSTVIGSVMSTSFVTDLLETILKKVAGENYELPSDIEFVNKYDERGKLVKAGELYYLYKGAKLLLNPDAIDTISVMMDTDSENRPSGMEDWIDLIGNFIGNEDKDGKKILDYLTESYLLQSFISEILIKTSETVENSIFYVSPKALATDENGETRRIIKSSEFKELAQAVPSLIETMKENLPLEKEDEEGNKSYDFEKIINILGCEGIDILSHNLIVQGIVGQFFNVSLKAQLMDGSSGSGYLKFPKSLETAEGWVNKTSSELIYLTEGINTMVSGVNISFTDLSSNFKLLLAKVMKLAESGRMGEVLNSKILHYTISSILDVYQIDESGQFVIIVPNSSTNTLADDNIDRVIKRDELVTLLQDVMLLGIFEVETDPETLEDDLVTNFDYNMIIYNIIKNKNMLFESNIISATISATICNVLSKNENLVVPARLIEAGKEENLLYYSPSNEWYNEIRYLFDAFDEVYQITFGNQIDSSSFTLNINTDMIFDLLKEYGEFSEVNSKYTRLELLLRSSVISATFTKTFDTYLTESIIDKRVRDKSKNDGLYTYDEISSLLDFYMLYNEEDTIDLTNISLDKFDIKNGFKINDDFSDPYRKFYLIRGILTTVIRNQNLLVPYYSDSSKAIIEHPRAFENYDNLPVLKKDEVQTIVDIYDDLGGYDGIQNLDASKIEFNKFLRYINDDKGVCRSYLLVSTISHYLMNEVKINIKYNGVPVQNKMTIPKHTVDSFAYTKEDNSKGYYYIIKLNEIVKLLSIFVQLEIDDVSKINNETIKTGSIYFFNSDIMNATICDNYIFNEQYTKVKYNNVNIGENINPNDGATSTDAVMLREDEYVALVEALKLLNVDGLDNTISINNFTDLLENLVSLKKVMKSSLIQIVLSEYLDDDAQSIKVKPDDTIAINSNEVKQAIELNNMTVMYSGSGIYVRSSGDRYYTQDFLNFYNEVYCELPYVDAEKVEFTKEPSGTGEIYKIKLIEFFNKLYLPYFNDNPDLYKVEKTTVSGGVYIVNEKRKDNSFLVYKTDDIVMLLLEFTKIQGSLA